MYLTHFKLNQFPFSTVPSQDFYCDLPSSEKLFNTMLSKLEEGIRLLTITGRSGTGKTILMQRLAECLKSKYTLIDLPQNAEQDIASVSEQSNPILLIDDAHTLSNVALKTLHRLLQVEKEGKKIVTVIIFTQKSVPRILKQPNQFSSSIKALNKKELHQYLCHRLNTVGCKNTDLFSRQAQNYLLRASAGSPQQLNVLAHKALLVSFGKGQSCVDTQAMKCAIADTENLRATRHFNQANSILALTIVVCLSVIGIVYRNAGLI